MKVTFVGCGDAFGSGGRFNTCFYVEGGAARFLIDCGATSLVALKAGRIAPNSIQTILITHFHADHFGGIPFFILDAQLVSKRTEPLIIAGPQGLRNCYQRALDVAFPGSSQTTQRFDLRLQELRPRETADLGNLRVTPFPVTHGRPGGPYYSYRIQAENRTIAYSGDTEWTDELIAAGFEADLFICEAYFREKRVKTHLDLATLVEHLGSICPKRLILTHMSHDMLDNLPNILFETAEDGRVVEL